MKINSTETGLPDETEGMSLHELFGSFKAFEEAKRKNRTKPPKTTTPPADEIKLMKKHELYGDPKFVPDKQATRL